MRCSKCGSDNREGAKFCKECASPLSTKCAACRALNQPGAKFCDECGAALVDAAQATVAEATPIAVSAAGERRHLTVLFCDLVGSTEIAAQLDPEEWREMVAGYHRVAAEAITRFGGYVAKYLGDGVMDFFGYPEAHDNDAERAARAGLAILDAIGKLDEHSDNQQLSARVGIGSGAVVVGVGTGKEADVFGDAPNIAARVQAAAEPGTVLITDAVHRLVFGAVHRGRPRGAATKRHRTADPTLSGDPAERSARAARSGSGGTWTYALRRPRGRIALADESLGTRARR